MPLTSKTGGKKELRYLCIAQSTPLVGLSLIPRLQLRCSSMEQSLRQQFGVKMRLLLSAGSYPCVLPPQLCQPCCFSHQHHESGQEIDLAEEQHSWECAGFFLLPSSQIAPTGFTWHKTEWHKLWCAAVGRQEGDGGRRFSQHTAPRCPTHAVTR